ncbi:hypothetical protein [Nonomuraea sp. KM90]
MTMLVMTVAFGLNTGSGLSSPPDFGAESGGLVLRQPGVDPTSPAIP